MVFYGRMMEKWINLKRKIFGFFLHPAMLSLLATLLIILILPTRYPKYLIEEVDQKFDNDDRLNFWTFLDTNRYSDYISVKQNPVGTTGVIVTLYPSEKKLQSNFKGKCSFHRGVPVLFGDFDNNRMNEIYLFTQEKDSIFLHSISHFEHKEPARPGRFITRVRMVNGLADAFIVPAIMDDLNEDGYKELMFGVSTGFSKYPRKMFGYDIKNDTLYQTKDNLSSLTNILQIDISGDGKYEYFPFGYASDNIYDSDTGFSYHDHSCWLMGFERQLNFLFQPVEFPGIFGGLTFYTLNDKNRNAHLLALYHYPKDSLKPDLLMKINSKGKIFNTCILPKEFRHGSGRVFVFPFKDQDFLGYFQSRDSLVLFDESFHIVDVLNPRFIPERFTVNDLDGDGENEWFFLNQKPRELIIAREGFRFLARLPVSVENYDFDRISFKKEPGRKPLIFINDGKKNYYFEYNPNPMYYGRFGIYGAIYLGLFLFASIIRKIQRTQLNKRFQAEKKITELQLKIVRNQLDPHFAMNAITSVVSAIQQNQKEDASQHLVQFSKLYRHLLLTADRMTCTLKEELEFTENYIKMEQFRFRDRFIYEKRIDPAVDLSFEVPKMAIQSHVENAIRHGLLPRNGGGILTIEISTDNSGLKIAVTDNGIGRKQAGLQASESTGKGHQMMKEFFELYQKISGQSVSYQIHDLYDETGKAAGTRVEIFLSLPSNLQTKT